LQYVSELQYERGKGALLIPRIGTGSRTHPKVSRARLEQVCCGGAVRQSEASEGGRQLLPFLLGFLHREAPLPVHHVISPLALDVAVPHDAAPGAPHERRYFNSVVLILVVFLLRFGLPARGAVVLAELEAGSVV
jgi:hypothetical protein